MAIKDSLDQIISNLQTAAADADKFDTGNKSAGVRVRKAAQEATKALKVVRQDVLDARNPDE
jgi:hypothetical protein